MRNALVVAAVIGSSVLSADAGDRLKLAVTPIKSLAPATISVRIRIEPDSENRALTVLVRSDEFYQSSEIPLDGESAQRSVELHYPNLPGGDYQIVGLLTDGTGRPCARASQPVEIVPVTHH